MEEKSDPLLLSSAAYPSVPPEDSLLPLQCPCLPPKRLFLRPGLPDSLTKSLNKATGGRWLIKMHLFALPPGCHLAATLSLETAKQNCCANVCVCEHARIQGTHVHVHTCT